MKKKDCLKQNTFLFFKVLYCFGSGAENEVSWLHYYLKISNTTSQWTERMGTFFVSSPTFTETFLILCHSNTEWNALSTSEWNTHKNQLLCFPHRLYHSNLLLSQLSLSLSQQTNSTRSLTRPHEDWHFQPSDRYTDWLKDVLSLCRSDTVICCKYHFLWNLLHCNHICNCTVWRESNHCCFQLSHV